jgi:vitamin-K-epoxide reductase (warfarin-sensitive)
MTGRTRIWLLACCLVGLAVSVEAAYIHYRILFDPRYVSFCDVNATFNCSQVYLSRFGTVLGVSVAVLGAIWFALAGILAAAGVWGTATVRDNVPGYLFALSTVALAVVLYLGYVSVAVLKTYCVLCLITYAAVISLFIMSGAATAFPMTTLPRRLARDLRVLVASPLAIAIAVLFLGGSVSAVAFFHAERPTSSAEAGPLSQDQRSEVERYMATAPRVALIIPTEGAKVLIVKFNDFQCPACGQSYLQYKAIFAKYEAQAPGAVRVVLKDYPLNPNCNPNVRAMVHEGACDAAVAVRLAQGRNRDVLEDWLYTHQPQLTPAVVRQAAHDVGMVKDFDAKYASTLALVQGDVGLGEQLHVTQTPTFFVNGVKIDGMWTPQYFDQAIAYELRRAGSAKP